MSSDHHNDRDRVRDKSLSDPEKSDPISEKRSPAALAHELANLIDAGMRNVGLVMSSLRDTPPPAGRERGDNDPLQRLETVNQAMRQMGHLLERWVDHGSKSQVVPDQDHTVGQTVQHVVNLFGPVAAQHGIEVRVSLSDAAAQLPAGPLYSVVANALRNSVEAMNGMGRQSKGVIELTGRVNEGQVELCVVDNGPGLDRKLIDTEGRFRFGITTKSSGHGIGLPLSRQICDGLGGTLEVRNAPTGGAVLSLRYPVGAIRRPQK